MPTLETDGATIHYTRVGSGPALLLIQGAGVVGEGWRPQIAGLADRHTVVAFDNRGIGASTLERGGRLTVADMARDALAIMDAERAAQFHVAGHSMGGLIAQSLALQVPKRVASIALLCTFVHGKQGAHMGPAMIATAIRMRVGTKAMRRNAFLELVMPRAYLDARDRASLAQDMAALFGYDLANQPLFVMRQVQAMARYDESRRWRDLRSIPTLVVSARDDRIALPRYGRALADVVPNSRFVEIPDAGHGVTIQCAADINALLAEHVAAAEAAGTRTVPS